MPTPAITVRELRRLWKPHKERLNAQAAEHPTTIRFHRACSWLQRAAESAPDDLDLALLSHWIAFNALYGQWDHEAREPLADQVCWKHFLERMLDLDQESHIVDTLEEHNGKSRLRVDCRSQCRLSDRKQKSNQPRGIRCIE